MDGEMREVYNELTEENKEVLNLVAQGMNIAQKERSCKNEHN